MPEFVKVGGANVHVCRLGSASVGFRTHCTGDLGPRLRTLSALLEEGVLSEELYQEAARAELAAWTSLRAH